MKIWRAGGAFRLIFTYPDLCRGSDGNVRKDLCSFNVLTHQHDNDTIKDSTPTERYNLVAS